MSATIAYPARAKLNLFLEVNGRRADGYHDLATVMATLDWGDDLAFAPDDSGVFSLRLEPVDEDGPGLPVPEGPDNLVLRAAGAWREAWRAAGGGPEPGGVFRLWKRVPAGAGLGGGSSDAALALRLLAKAFGPLGADAATAARRLADTAARVGSDVPFFLAGGVCLAEGRGERLTPLPRAARALAGTVVTVFVPSCAVATPAAYAALAGRTLGTRPVAPFLAALDAGGAWAARAYNRFEEAADAFAPELAAFARTLARLGVRHARLSGSGSAWWAVGDHTELAPALRAAGAGRVRRVRLETAPEREKEDARA